MEIAAVLSRAVCFIAIIFLGYGLKRVGLFQPEDFHVLSKIVLKITLPASIVFSFSGKAIELPMLSLGLFGFGGCLLYLGAGFLINIRKSKEDQAFAVQNLPGYNIGNFTLPFVQSFLGPSGVVITSLFDIGNAIFCLGGSYSIAAMVKGEGKGIPAAQIVKTLLKSVPFDAYLIMTALCLLNLSLPESVVSFAEIIANANAFAAMLMIGVGFKLSGNRAQARMLIKLLTARYGIAIAFSAALYFLLPMPLEYRQTLAILAFAPASSSGPAFTADLKGDIGLSSAFNSLSILISIGCIVGMLALTL